MSTKLILNFLGPVTFLGEFGHIPQLKLRIPILTTSVFTGWKNTKQALVICSSLRSKCAENLHLNLKHALICFFTIGLQVPFSYEFLNVFNLSMDCQKIGNDVVLSFMTQVQINCVPSSASSWVQRPWQLGHLHMVYAVLSYLPMKPCRRFD